MPPWRSIPTTPWPTPAWRASGLELNPNYADAHIFSSHLLTVMGNEEAGTAAAIRALELDPLNPFYQGLYGIQLSLTGRYEAAVTQIRHSHEMAPGFNFARQALAYILAHIGHPGEALVELRVHYESIDDRESLAALETGEAQSGYRGAVKAAANLLAQRSRSEWIHLFDIQHLYDQAGETAQALEWFERGYELHDPDLPYMGAFLVSGRLRAEPGYRDLLDRMDLTDLRASQTTGG